MKFSSFLFSAIIVFCSFGLHAQSTEKDFDYQTIEQADDYEGRVVCTLISHKNNTHNKKAVLYLHGYNDYFFQHQMADSVLKHNLDFYAIELRKYGRSKLENQTWFELRDIEEYFPDIDSAISRMKAAGVEDIYFMAHSTGGLISSLYLDKRQNETAVKALILNSPFLDFNLPAYQKNVLIPFLGFFKPVIGNMRISQGDDSKYAESLLKDFEGEWIYDTTMKISPSPSVSVYWLSAIKKGHRQIKKGLNIKQPVLVLSSDNSNAEPKTSDIVLNYEHIQSRADKLGKNVTKKIIPQGKHDLALSIEPARNQFYKEIFDFIDRN